jgi:adenylate cyclase
MKFVKKLKSVIISTSVIIFLFVAYFIFASFFEPKAYNFMVNTFSANTQGSNDVVIITIDDKSLDKIRWPWKRELYAKIFNYLHEYSAAKMVGFDAIIVTPDKDNLASDRTFYNTVGKINNLVVGFSPANTPYASPKQGEFYDKQFANKFSLKINDKRHHKEDPYYISLSEFPQEYFNAIKNTGSVVTTPLDIDGFLRTMDQLIDYRGHLYPSIGLKMYAQMHNIKELTVTDNAIIDTKTNLKIPVFTASNDNVYNFMHFYKTYPNSDYTHKTYSAIDIINSYDLMKKGKQPIISPQVFEDKVVIVGANAKAVAMGLEDTKSTPIEIDHPGADIQATNIDNLINKQFIKTTNTFTDILILTVLLVSTFLIVRYFSLVVSLGLIALIVVSYIAICIICFRFNLAINVITPLALQLIVMAMAYSYRFILEGRNKEKIKNAMGKYISENVMQNVVKNIDEVKLGGKRANVTVLFADIRGFTSMSEKLTAEEVSVILNEYFARIEPIITKYNGVINKFIGDAVMAIFGEPVQDKSHAINAVKCAYEMLLEVQKLQAKWLQEGKPKIEIGIGINTGEAFVGNIGTENRLEYTVIGDMVNVASRIESFNKVYKTSFLISESTYDKVRHLADVIKISEVSIRGKAKKTNIYEVLRLAK